MKVPILLFHPITQESRASRALVEAACTVHGVNVVDMTALYPYDNINTATEVNRTPLRTEVGEPLPRLSSERIIITAARTEFKICGEASRVVMISISEGHRRSCGELICSE